MVVKSEVFEISRIGKRSVVDRAFRYIFSKVAFLDLFSSGRKKYLRNPCIFTFGAIISKIVQIRVGVVMTKIVNNHPLNMSVSQYTRNSI